MTLHSGSENLAANVDVLDHDKIGREVLNTQHEKFIRSQQGFAYFFHLVLLPQKIANMGVSGYSWC